MRDPHNAGDNHQSELETESPELEPGLKPLVMPKKADLARGSQARRLREFQAANRRPGSARHAADLEARTHQQAEQSPTRSLGAHPLSRRRQAGRGFSTAGLGRAFRSLTGAVSSRSSGVSSQAFQPANIRGLVFRRPTVRGSVALAGVAGIVCIVAAMLITLPNQPSAPSASGSVYGVTWHGAGKMPTPKLDFGPFFTTYGTDTIMVGSVVDTKDGKSTATTTVWASRDGLTWSQRSQSGSFDVGGRRFVPQGISDDGNGGLVVVGNSFGSGSTDVAASAWHSRDGASWNSMPVDNGNGQEMVGGVATRSGSIVAAGNGLAWLSTDGLTWSQKLLPGAGSYTLKSVGSWNGGFVIVGLWNGTGPTRKPGSAVWFSPNGSNWLQAPTSLDGFDVRGIAGIGSRVVLAGTDTGANAPGLAASWSSSDGGTWTKSTAPTDDLTVSLDGVVAANGSFLAYGAPAVLPEPKSASSPTPTASPTPTPTPTPTDTPTPTPSPAASGSVRPSGSAGSSASAKASASASAPASAGASGSAAASASAKLTPAPASPTAAPPVAEFVWVSDDGLSWLPISSNAAPLAHGRIVANGGSLVFIGRDTAGLTSVSGNLVMGVARSTTLQTAAPGQFDLSLSTGNSPMIPGLTKNDSLVDVASSSNRFVVFVTGPVGTSIWSSSDGRLWAQEADPDALTTKGTVGRPVILSAISDGHGGIIATGKVTNDAGDNGVIWHQVPGSTWHQVTISDAAPPEISSVTAGEGGYVAASDVAGGSKILYSADGETWQAGAIAVADTFALSVSSYRYGYVAVGFDPTRIGTTTAWTSPDGRTWTIHADWRLPTYVTKLFGVGNGLVAVAKNVAPSANPSPSAVASSKSASPSASPSPTPKPVVTPKPTPTPTPAPPTYTWYWSSSGVVWQPTGLTTSGGDSTFVNGELVVVDSPSTAGSGWTVYTTADGKSWQRPTLQADSSTVQFKGSTVCGITSVGGHIAIIGTDAPGQLKDYFGRLVAR